MSKQDPEKKDETLSETFGSAGKRKPLVHFSARPMLPSCDMKVSRESGNWLTRAISPVKKALKIFGRKARAAKNAFARAAVKVGKFAVSTLSGEALYEKIQEVSANLRDHKFASAVALTLAAGVEVAGMLTGQHLLGFALSTGIVVATHALLQEDEKPKLKPAYAFARP
ncbi:MAG: hypothetical protein GC185_03740 [Alphaproteobacteria bacterium]|nr:hypothetical protein [Alphaproteobacteria bacterium]